MEVGEACTPDGQLERVTPEGSMQYLLHPKGRTGQRR